MVFTKGHKGYWKNRKRSYEAQYGKEKSIELKNKLSLSHKGLHNSPETQFKKGNSPPMHQEDCKCFRCTKIPSNPFKKGQISPRKGVKLSEKTKSKISLNHKGKTAWNKGLKGYNSGKKNVNWKGGISPLNKRIRQSFEYRQWRSQVFNRDNHTCQECGQRGCYLEAHHIKPFAFFPELRFNVDNGITYCKECHILNDINRGVKSA